MNISRFQRAFVLWLFMLVSTAALAACKNGTTDQDVEELGAITEGFGATTVSISVSPDGELAGQVKRDGVLLKKGVSGEVSTRPLSGKDDPVTAVPVEQDKDSGVLKAALPALKGQLTELNYKLMVEGTPVAGTIHLPEGGTPALVNSAKEAADAKHVNDDTRGPNGGIVQVVGKDTIEIVADKKSGEVRAYVLDASLKPVAVGKRELRLVTTTAERPESVMLSPSQDGAYFSGKLTVKTNPSKITLVVVDEERRPHVALCHYHPREVIVHGHDKVGVAIYADVDWRPPAIVVSDHHDVKVVKVTSHVYHDDCDHKDCKHKHHEYHDCEHCKHKKHKK